YLLGGFRFNLSSLVIPLGFALYLIFFKPSLNKNVKKLAATFGFIIFCVGIVIPAVEENWYSREIKLQMTSDNINSIDFLEDLNVIRNKFNLQKPLDINHFEVRYNKDGQINKLTYEVIDYRNSEEIGYSVSYFSNAYKLGNKKKYSITRRKTNNIFKDEKHLDADLFFDNINKIKEEKINYDFGEYTISLMEKSMNYQQIENIKDFKYIYMDRNNSTRELKKEDFPIQGSRVFHYGSVIDDIKQGSISSHGSDIGAVNYILES
ncbi:MAG: hypothetical protein ACRDA5_15175, partial [Clostridium sp.]